MLSMIQSPFRNRQARYPNAHDTDHTPSNHRLPRPPSARNYLQPFDTELRELGGANWSNERIANEARASIVTFPGQNRSPVVSFTTPIHTVDHSTPISSLNQSNYQSFEY